MATLGRLGAVCALVLLACGGGSSSSSSSTGGASSSASSSAAPKGPPTATITLTGDAGVTGNVAGTGGPVSGVNVSCDNPGLDGNTITLGGYAAGATDPETGTSVTVFLSTGSVFVRVSRGSGADFQVREFTGTGLTGFDPATGAQIDSPLTETTSADSNKGDLGAVTAAKGSVDCGNFDPGTATLRLTGSTPDGAVDGVLDPVLVTCTTNLQGQFVVVRGIAAVGSTKAIFFVTTQPDGKISIFETVKPSGQHQYLAPPGSGTLTATGATMKGDAVEQNVTTPPHTVHVEGDAHCGS